MKNHLATPVPPWIGCFFAATGIALLASCEPVAEPSETAAEPLATSDDGTGAEAGSTQEPAEANEPEAQTVAAAAAEAEAPPEIADTVDRKRCYAGAAGSPQDAPSNDAGSQNVVQSGFETPCHDLLTPDFIATLQRALAARAYFNGPITGEMTAATRSAVAAYQADAVDLDSDTLSVDAARKLGLIAVERPDSD